MKKLASVVILSSVLVMGLFAGSSFNFADAAHDGNPGKSQGCSKGEAKNNPHCDVGTSEPPLECVAGVESENNRDGDLYCNDVDFCPDDPVGDAGQSKGDLDGDGFPNGRDAHPCISSLHE